MHISKSPVIGKLKEPYLYRAIEALAFVFFFHRSLFAFFFLDLLGRWALDSIFDDERN